MEDRRVRAIQDSGKITRIPGRRNELIATADVRLVQAQVINKHSELVNVVIWQCGPDVLYARSMQDFASGNYHNAPKWLREALDTLPAGSRFDYRGRPASDLAAPIKLANDEGRPAATGDLFLADSDAPDVIQG